MDGHFGAVGVQSGLLFGSDSEPSIIARDQTSSREAELISPARPVSASSGRFPGSGQREAYGTVLRGESEQALELSVLAYTFAEQGQLTSAATAAWQALRLDPVGPHAAQARGVLKYARLNSATFAARNPKRSGAGVGGRSTVRRRERRPGWRRSSGNNGGPAAQAMSAVRLEEIQQGWTVEHEESWVTMDHAIPVSQEITKRVAELEVRQSLQEQAEAKRIDNERARLASLKDSGFQTEISGPVTVAKLAEQEEAEAEQAEAEARREEVEARAAQQRAEHEREEARLAALAADKEARDVAIVAAQLKAARQMEAAEAAKVEAGLVTNQDRLPALREQAGPAPARTGTLRPPV